MLEDMVAAGVAPNAVTYTAALDLSVNILVRAPPGSHSQDLAKDLCLLLIARVQCVPGGGGGGEHAHRQRVRTLTYALNLVLRAMLPTKGRGGWGEAEGRGSQGMQGMQEMQGMQGMQAVVGVVAALLDEGAEPDVITYNTLLLRLLKRAHSKKSYYTVP